MDLVEEALSHSAYEGDIFARLSDEIARLRAELAARDAEIAEWIWQWTRVREAELTIPERETADTLARAIKAGAYRSNDDAERG